MTYPETIDSDTELIEGVSPLVVAEVNAIRNSIIAIERELGILPSGTFGTVVDRFATVGAGEIRAADILTDADGYLMGVSVETALRDQFVEAALSRKRFFFNAIDVVDDKTYSLALDSPNGGSITSISVETDSGTCDASITIDGVELDLISVSNVRQILAYSVGNGFSPNSEILMIVSGNLEALMLKCLVEYSSL
jgi:hypothetical protein